MRLASLAAIGLLAVTPCFAASLTDVEVKQAVIQESLAGYSGNCPCPYNADRRGRSCGARSAYSRPGGYAPICYPRQVTPAMVLEYRRNH